MAAHAKRGDCLVPATWLALVLLVPGITTASGQLPPKIWDVKLGVIRERFPAILDAAPKMGGAQIRNMATIGGNVANANRSADLPPVLLAMDASVSLWSSAGERILPLTDFFIGPKQTARRADEVLTEIFIPDPAEGSGAAFARFTLRGGHAIAVAGVAANLKFGRDGAVREARIGLSGVFPTVRLAEAAAGCLTGRTLDDTSIERAATAAAEAPEPMVSDLRGRSDFRQALVVSLTRRALITARERALAKQESRRPAPTHFAPPADDRATAEPS